MRSPLKTSCERKCAVRATDDAAVSLCELFVLEYAGARQG